MFCLNQQVLMYYQRNKRERGGRKEDDEDDAKMQAHIKDFKKKSHATGQQMIVTMRVQDIII